jgi:tetratricopeptide (TPR) repeat protein
MLAPILILFAAQASADPAALWQEAKGYLEHQQYAEARRVLTLAVKAAPNDPAFWFHLGVSCAELKDVDAAIHAFEKTRALSPNRAEVHFSLGLEYWHRGDLGKAKEAYRTGLTLEPKNTQALQNYALLLMKTGEHGRAIDPLLKLKGVPELTLPARVSLIECYLKTGDRQQADRETDDFLQAGIAGPEDETKLGALLIEGGDPEAAERVLRASLDRQPDQAKACAALGALLLSKKSYPEASRFLGQAVHLEPASAEYAMAFAEALLQGNRQSEVLGFLKEVEPKFGHLPEFQYKLALAYFGATQFADAIATLDKLLQANPRRQDRIYYLLGHSYVATGKLGEAEQAYQKAIEMNPKIPVYYEEFATVLRREGPEHLDEAIAELKRGVQFDPSNPGLALQLALCYEAKGDMTSAVSLAEEAVRRQPDVLPAHVALARIYFRLGKKVEGQKEKETIATLEKKQQESLVPKAGQLPIIDGQLP